MIVWVLLPSSLPRVQGNEIEIEMVPCGCWILALPYTIFTDHRQCFGERMEEAVQCPFGHSTELDDNDISALFRHSIKIFPLRKYWPAPLYFTYSYKSIYYIKREAYAYWPSQHIIMWSNTNWRNEWWGFLQNQHRHGYVSSICRTLDDTVHTCCLLLVAFFPNHWMNYRTLIYSHYSQHQQLA